MANCKKIISLVLCLMVVMGIVTVGAFSASAATTGNVTLGSYPQSKVTDSTLISKLNAQVKNTDFKSYDYYFVNGKEKAMEQNDSMMYADVTYGGSKYRAVRINAYRPYSTITGYDSNKYDQSDNGYYKSNIYWFKFEPIKWVVLDAESGLLLSNMILDSQDYQDELFIKAGESYSNEEFSRYANDYSESRIRAWLTEEFYDTAFSEAEKALLDDCFVDNSSPYGKYSSEVTTDKVYLLSYTELQVKSYGFTNSTNATPTRMAKGTDYAKAQGLQVSNNGSYSGYSPWWMRTAYGSSDTACVVSWGGDLTFSNNVTSTIQGVRPAIKLTKETCNAGIHIDTNNDGRCERCGQRITDILPVEYDLARATIKVPNGKLVRWRYKVTMTATAVGLPSQFNIAIFDGTKLVAKGDSNSVKYTTDQLRTDKELRVVFVDSGNQIVSNASQDKTIDITVNTGIIARIISFFARLFGRNVVTL